MEYGTIIANHGGELLRAIEAGGGDAAESRMLLDAAVNRIGELRAVDRQQVRWREESRLEVLRNQLRVMVERERADPARVPNIADDLNLRLRQFLRGTAETPQPT